MYSNCPLIVISLRCLSCTDSPLSFGNLLGRAIFSSLRELRLINTNLTDENISDVILVLLRNSSVQLSLLDLRGNGPLNTSGDLLMRYLSSSASHPLTWLGLDYTRLSLSNSPSTLTSSLSSRAFRLPPALQCLHLSMNRLRDADAESIATAIRHSRGFLLVLDISCNFFTVDGIFMILKAIHSKRRKEKDGATSKPGEEPFLMEYLNVTGNKLGGDYCQEGDYFTTFSSFASNARSPLSTNRRTPTKSTSAQTGQHTTTEMLRLARSISRVVVCRAHCGTGLADGSVEI